MGHADAKILTDVYLKLVTPAAIAAANRIERHMFGREAA
jgi:hypothetical protein